MRVIHFSFDSNLSFFNRFKVVEYLLNILLIMVFLSSTEFFYLLCCSIVNTSFSLSFSFVYFVSVLISTLFLCKVLLDL